VHGRRYGNVHDRAEWMRRLERGASCEAESEFPDADARAREVVMLGLRLAHGLRAADHDADVWRDVEARYGAAFERAVATGRLERRDGALAIRAAHRFVADDVIAWLDAGAVAAAASA